MFSVLSISGQGSVVKTSDCRFTPIGIFTSYNHVGIFRCVLADDRGAQSDTPLHRPHRLPGHRRPRGRWPPAVFSCPMLPALCISPEVFMSTGLRDDWHSLPRGVGVRCGLALRHTSDRHHGFFSSIPKHISCMTINIKTHRYHDYDFHHFFPFSIPWMESESKNNTNTMSPQLNDPYFKRLLGEKEDPTCAILQRHNIRSSGPLRQPVHRTTENPTPRNSLFC